MVDPLDLPARLDELRELRDGWLDGIGKAPASEGLDWFARAFEQHFPDDLPLPYVYPTAEGGIQTEWSLEPYEVTLEVDLQAHRGEWHALDMGTERAETRDQNLDDPSEWVWLAYQVRRFAGGAARQRKRCCFAGSCSPSTSVR